VTPAGKASQWNAGIVRFGLSPWSSGFSEGFGPAP
jgi:hypothetical protein